MATPAGKEPPHRLSMGRIIELLLTRPSDHSTISLNRKPNGDTEVGVSVRAHGELTVEGAEQLCREVYDRLCSAYPPATDDDSDATTVSMSRNAKGETQLEVSARGKGQPKDVAGRVRVEYDRLRAAYPMASGFVGAKPQAGSGGPDDGGKA